MKAAAEALFREARELMAANKVADARAKLLESYALDPAVGTLLDIAECEVGLGDIVAACAHFREALRLVRAKSPISEARAKFIEEQVTAFHCAP